MFCDQVIECLKMSCFLVVHVFHQGSEVRVGADDLGCLSGVDQRGGQLASLIDTESTVHEFSLFFTEDISRLRLTGGDG